MSSPAAPRWSPGGGRGIGKAVAAELSRGGASLVVIDVDAERLAAACAELRLLYVAVTGVPGTVTHPDCLRDLVHTAAHEHGRVALLLARRPWRTDELDRP